MFWSNCSSQVSPKSFRVARPTARKRSGTTRETRRTRLGESVPVERTSKPPSFSKRSSPGRAESRHEEIELVDKAGDRDRDRLPRRVVERRGEATASRPVEVLYEQTVDSRLEQGRARARLGAVRALEAVVDNQLPVHED